MLSLNLSNLEGVTLTSIFTGSILWNQAMMTPALLLQMHLHAQ